MAAIHARLAAVTRPASTWLKAILAVIVASCIAAAAAGFGHRWGWWHFRTGFTVLRWAVFVGAAAGAISLVAFIVAAVRGHTRNVLVGLAGAMLAAALVLPVWQLQRTGAAAPRIHDITTDTENPPTFVDILPLRESASNPAEYAGPAAAEQQKKAYADIGPVLLPLPPDQAFRQALAAAREMGWEIVAQVPAEGRIEAVDETFWFGFRDDVVIRVSPADTGSRVDVRSKSRVGRADFGTNAKRVRTYTRMLQSGG